MILICISDFCCGYHVNDCLEAKIECMKYMDELVESILSHTVVGHELSHLSLM